MALPTTTPTGAARLLGVSRPTVARWIKDGLLEDVPVGSDHRIPASSVRSLQHERIAAGRRAMAVLDGSAGPEAKGRAEAARSRARERMARR